jgi:hypothetical protein
MTGTDIGTTLYGVPENLDVRQFRRAIACIPRALAGRGAACEGLLGAGCRVRTRMTEKGDSRLTRLGF